MLLQGSVATGWYPYGADVAFDQNGDALAVWHRYDGTIESIWASRYSAQSGTWSAPEVISDPTVARNASPKIEFDAVGNAMAVWSSVGATWANYYSAADGRWRTAAIVDDKLYPEPFGNADFAFDHQGNVLMVWAQAARWAQPSVISIWFNTYDAASGLWGTSRTIESDDLHHAALPKIAVDSNGNALAVWEHNDGTRTNIMANRYTYSTKSWGTETLIEHDDVGYAWSPDVAVDAKGNAFAVWKQSNGIGYDAYACRYLAGSNTWGTPTLLETLAEDVGYVQIAVDANGDAVALWMQALTRDHWSSLYSTRFDASTGSWSTAAAIENFDSTSIYPELSIGANGNVMAIWEERAASNDVVANYYDAATKTWAVAAPVESESDSAKYPTVAVAPDGTAIAIWSQSDSLWASRYQP